MRYSIPTGHPPVMEQIAHQVRSATGVTYLARPTYEGLVAFRTPAPEPAAAPEPVAAAEPKLSRADMLMAVLVRLSQEGSRLPPIAEIADELGWENGTVSSRLWFLATVGRIKSWVCDDPAHRGERVIQVPGFDYCLRTANAPPHLRFD